MEEEMSCIHSEEYYLLVYLTGEFDYGSPGQPSHPSPAIALALPRFWKVNS